MNGSPREFINFVKAQPGTEEIDHTSWSSCAIGDYAIFEISGLEWIEFTEKKWNVLARRVLVPIIIQDSMKTFLGNKWGEQAFNPSLHRYPELNGVPSDFSTLFGLLAHSNAATTTIKTYGHLYQFMKKHTNASQL